MSTSLPASDAAHDDIFVGTGEMAQLMRAHDWAATPLGPPAQWPNTLKVAMRLLLSSRFEMWLGWGPDILFFYNDAYRPTLGTKHPRSLAMPTKELWSEIWHDVEPRLRRVYENGEATWDRALLLLLNRNGYPEETYHTFSYSPLLGDTGTVDGVFCAVSEDTDRVIGERRMATLRVLASSLSAADSRAAVLSAARERLAENRHDLPFTLTYLFGDDGRAHLGGATGIGTDHHCAPLEIALDNDCWDLRDIWSGADAHVRPLRTDDLPSGAWDRAPTHAAFVPLVGQGRERPLGTLVVGLNPYRHPDEGYLGFVKLVAGQFAASLSSAEAIEMRAAERDRLNRLFEQSPSFMCLLQGPTHDFTLVNESYRQLVGHRQLLGLPVREALPEIEGQGFFELLDNVYRTGTPYIGRNLPVQVQRVANGPLEQRYLHLVYQPVVDASGKTTGIFVDGFDVTEQQAAEAELQTFAATLEQRVADRTEELARALDHLQRESTEREHAQAALRQAQRMESLGALTGGVAHDFNNLLQVISGNLSLLSRDVVGNARAEKRVDSAMAGVARGSKLASQLLAFGRRQPLEPKVVNIGRFLKTFDDMMRRALGEEVEVETVVSGGLWNTLVDPGQIENAILNLVINARDAMEGRGKLTIEAGNAMLDDTYARQHDDVQPGQYVMMAVTDTGSGIRPELLDRVFEPFFSTKPEGKGTGLGLSMVYGFVKQSGGHVKVYSELGEGTTVRIYLPRVLQSEDVLADTGSAPAQGGSETILVVEDDEAVRETAVALLAELGYRVLKAADATSALSVIESGVPIDLLFTDVVMPGPLRSPELARKARERLPDLAVLFTSGYTENAIVHGGRLDAGVELLSKPYSSEALARKLRHVFATQGRGGVSAPSVPRPLTVLLVEDDALIRESAADLLSEQQHRVIEARDADIALAALAAGTIDVLVVDIGLPGLSGADLARQAVDRWPSLGVVFATGNRAAAEDAAIEGAIVLLKPYRLHDLSLAIRQVARR